MKAEQLGAGRSYLLVLAFLMTYMAGAAQSGGLSGFIRDEQGAPISGARITLAGGASSPAALATTSDANGAYHFLSLPSGAYRLEVSLTGFQTKQSGVIAISDAPADLTVDLTMSRTPLGMGASGAGPTSPRPQFEASGIRGLIDPGGYSASAHAAAASGLINGIADIKRAGNEPNTSVSAPCSLEPALKKAAADKPDSAEANFRLGEFYLAHGQAVKAIPILERARGINESSREILERLAEAYLKAGRFDAAQTLLTPLAPVLDIPEVYRLLARANEGSGKFVEAARNYQAAANQEPSEENLFGSGYELILTGSAKGAEQVFETAVKRYPRSVQLLIGLGSAQFLQGNAAESIQTLLRAVELNPSDPRPYPFLAGASGLSSADAERVHVAFENFLRAAPNDPRASYYCALNLLQQSAVDLKTDGGNIEALLKHALLLDPGLTDAHFQLGVLDSRRGDYGDAAQELETAVKLSPNFKEAHYRLAMVYRQTGRMELSEKEMLRFREAPEASSRMTAGGLSTGQFISVLETPGIGVRHETLCPGDAP